MNIVQKSSWQLSPRGGVIETLRKTKPPPNSRSAALAIKLSIPQSDHRPIMKAAPRNNQLLSTRQKICDPDLLTRASACALRDRSIILFRSDLMNQTASHGPARDCDSCRCRPHTLLFFSLAVSATYNKLRACMQIHNALYICKKNSKMRLYHWASL